MSHPTCLPHPHDPLTLDQLEDRTVPSTFGDDGILFNDATRLLEGGLWQLATPESNQPQGTVGRYVSDLSAVKANLTDELAHGDLSNVSAATRADVNRIISRLGVAIAQAPASADTAGTNPAATAAAQDVLRAAHLRVLNVVANNPTLADLAAAGGAGGFQIVPPRLPTGVTAANAPRDNLAEVGAIFNDAANRMLGGLGGTANRAAIVADLQAVRSGIHELRAKFPDVFSGLSGIHADLIERNINLELQKGINEAGVNPVANKFSSDIMLDVIDIVQGDTNLANMAGTTGFEVLPPSTRPPTPYQDNQSQTAYLATVISQANTLGRRVVNTVTRHPGDTARINALIRDLVAFQNYATSFLSAQGGLFEARFDNEFLGENSTNGAAIDAAVQALSTRNVGLALAAADQLHENAADVAGNNIPVTGGSYNVDGLTVADVLSTAHG